MDADEIISMLDYILKSKRKRHIIGGVLLSISLLFGGLSITAFTSGKDEENE